MKNIFAIIKLARPLYGILAIIALLIVIGALLDLVVPILSKYIVDEIVAQVGHQNGSLNRLILFIGLTFGLGLLGIIVSSISDRLGGHFSGRLRKFLT